MPARTARTSRTPSTTSTRSIPRMAPSASTARTGLALYSWVPPAYLPPSTVMVPIWGKLGDLYGRKPILLAGILLFLLGSWLSGLSGEFGDLPLIGGGMVQLIVFRAVQGIG